MKHFLWAPKIPHSSGAHSSYLSLSLASSSHLPLPLTSHCLIFKCPRCGTVGPLPSRLKAGFLQSQGSPYHLNNDRTHISVFNLTSPLNSRLAYPDALESSHTSYPIMQWLLVALSLKYTYNLSVSLPLSFPWVTTMVSQILPLHLLIWFSMRKPEQS